MKVIILHPSDELKLVSLQKELISELFEDGRILAAARPLWIPAAPVEVFVNHPIELDDLETSETSIFIPVRITTDKAEYLSKLTLVNIHSGRPFSGYDRQKLAEIKQPVRQLKVFRLGLEKELSSVSKCITESKWMKIK